MDNFSKITKHKYFKPAAIIIFICFIGSLFYPKKNQDNPKNQETEIHGLAAVETAQVKNQDPPKTEISQELSSESQETPGEESAVLNEVKESSLKEVNNMTFLNAGQVADFSNKISSKEKTSEVKAVLEEAKKANEENSKANKGPESGKTSFEKARVTRVVDGDTVVVEIKGNSYKLRLIGIDTPEVKHPKKGVEFFGKEASAFTYKNLNNRDIYLEKDVSNTDKYNRLLRYIWLTPPKNEGNPSYKEVRDQTFNGILVREGYANASTYPPDVKYSKLFSKIEREAREANRGLWDEAKRTGWEAANGGKSQANAKNTEGKQVAGNKNSKSEKSGQTEKTSKARNNSSSVSAALSKPAATKAPASKPSSSQPAPTQSGPWVQTMKEVTNRGKTYWADTTQGPVKGNRNSKKYHVRGQQGYNKISIRNVVWFRSTSEAQEAGYVAAKR